MKWIKYIFTILLFAFIALNFNTITDYVASFLRKEPKVVINDPNSYYKDYSYDYVKLSKDYIPYSKQDLMDIFYSIINSGYDTFTFYCPSEYTECINDVELLSDDDETLTNINNFVNPYNSFSNIKIIYSSLGEVNVEVTKLYNEDTINAINNKINEIKNNILKDEKLEDKILLIHDYIINNTSYDEERKDGNSKYLSNIAYGSLIEGKAVCGGYADAMALFLDDLKVPNFKVSSDTHVWNAVYINNKWLHLDLTWDDPVTLNSNKQTLTHKFYLIDTPALENYKIEDHDFDKAVFKELS